MNHGAAPSFFHSSARTMTGGVPQRQKQTDPPFSLAAKIAAGG